MSDNAFRIAVLPGDGIGVEVMDACLVVLEKLEEKTKAFALAPETLPAGAMCYREHGSDLPEETLRKSDEADAILLGACGWPEIRKDDGTEIAPQIELREHFGLISGVRPIRAIPGVPLPLSDPRAKDIDLVIVRESTEGLFKGRENGVVIDDREARDTQIITRSVSEQLFRFSFELAQARKARGKPGRVTCIDKANVLASMAFFRKIFDEIATEFPDCEADHHYVDAAAFDLVRRPWTFDVMPTENMYGDIISDLAAGLIGGMGFAPSADIGDGHAVFQPSHGTAPDIAGQGKANPTAMILSAAMMLDWLGRRHNEPDCVEAGALLEKAVDNAFAGGELRTADFGGPAGTADVTNAVLAGI
ncbi:MAG: isocitrate/isopropylmalate dehydrogenase family protein [Alphaproteobacteria bacterium]|jgi:3-isopropylmalate dehydrogenase|nr:isocitrate/isopropylmalate dehydrogenase family protein [Alphaproteobacteria bacterium]